jgi:hypothetical protein
VNPKISKKLFNCHRCLIINSKGECGPDKFRYKVKGRDVNGTRVIHCDGNEEGSCQKSLCECDTAFAKELLIMKDDYHRENSKWQGFKQSDNCRKFEGIDGRSSMLNPTYPTQGIETHNGWACCGDHYDNYQPYNPSKGSLCCNVKSSFLTYILYKEECCSDGNVEPIGHCASLR